MPDVGSPGMCNGKRCVRRSSQKRSGCTHRKNGKVLKAVFKIWLSYEIPGQARNDKQSINLSLAGSKVIANFSRTVIIVLIEVV